MNRKQAEYVLADALLILTSPIFLPAVGQTQETRNSLKLKAHLVGVVVATSSATGETASASLVADPADYQGVAGLTVITATIPLPHDSRGRASLEGVVVRPAGGLRQPASSAVTYTVPDTFAIPFTIALAETAASLGEVNVPVQARSPLPARQGEFAMQPVVPSSGVCEVDGPFGGDSAKTQAAVNDQPARILAETRRQLFFRPRALRDGRNGVKITEGRRSLRRSIRPQSRIQTSKTTLAQNETAEVEVHVSKMADNGWGSTARGALLLTIKNNSPDTVSFPGPAVK